jgi:uncharacterized protein (DUF2267 family)
MLVAQYLTSHFQEHFFMPNYGIPAFAHAAQQAQQWVNELSEDLNWNDKGRAYRLLKSVLHAVRDWISAEEVADLSAQLPLFIRGVYFEGWDPMKARTVYRKRADFIARVESDFVSDPLVMPAEDVGKVLEFLSRKLPGGEVRQVRQSMPKSLRALWADG